jgi:hypothetical protein
MFGKLMAFGPTSVERVTEDGRTQVERHVEYHGQGSSIAVLSRESGSQPTILRLSDPDHATSAMGCTLQRGRTRRGRHARGADAGDGSRRPARQ